MMIELDVFKSYFYLWRVLWIQGPKGARKTRITYEFLRYCKVQSQEVMQVTGLQFVELIEKGLSKECGKWFRVLLIKDFEGLESDQVERLLRALVNYNEFKKQYQFRVVMISSGLFLEGNHFEQLLRPVIIKIKGMGSDPTDMNERAHNLIEKASVLARKKVKRISESVACLIEILIREESEEEEVIAFLVLALIRMEGQELQIRHCFQGMEQKKRRESRAKTLQLVVN